MPTLPGVQPATSVAWPNRTVQFLSSTRDMASSTGSSSDLPLMFLGGVAKQKRTEMLLCGVAKQNRTVMLLCGLWSGKTEQYRACPGYNFQNRVFQGCPCVLGMQCYWVPKLHWCSITQLHYSVMQHYWIQCSAIQYYCVSVTQWHRSIMFQHFRTPHVPLFQRSHSPLSLHLCLVWIHHLHHCRVPESARMSCLWSRQSDSP